MKLSVIVCTRNRAHAIIACLDSIAQSLARVSPINAEIVVVNNGSQDNTASLLREWTNVCPFTVNLQFEPCKGTAKARNLGLRTAKGELLIWIDDDCRMDEDHISAALRHDASDNKLVLRGGRVELGDPTDLPITIKTDFNASRWSRDTHYARNANLFDRVHGCMMIIWCNTTMRRGIVERVGFFDERFGPGTSVRSAEDQDYILRAYLAGITVEYVPDMRVFHCHGRKLVYDGKALMRDYMIGHGALYAKYLFKYPDLCRPFYWDIKNLIHEIGSGSNTFWPDVGFSHKDKLIYNILGAAKFFAVSMRRSP